MSTQIGYKASELGMIPQDWDVVKLGDVFEVTAGGDLDVTNFSAEKTHKHIYPVYSNAITDNGLYGFSSNYDCCGNHITVTARGYIGYAIPRNGKFSSIGRLLTLQPKTEISCYLVAQYINQFVSFAIESTGVPQLTAPQIKKYLVAIPKSIAEQTAIATALSDTDSLISSLQTLIAKKKAIKLSAMQNLLSGKIRLPEFALRPDGSPKTTHQTELGLLPEDWEVVELGKLTTFINDGTHHTPQYVDSGIPFYSVENITNNDFHNVKYISIEEHNKLIKRCKPEEGDLLLTRIGTLGLTKLIDWDICASIYVSLALLKFKEGINVKYIYEYSKSNLFKNEISKRALLNATPPKINMDQISKIRIFIPKSTTEQTAIAQLLSDMDAEIEALVSRLKKTQSLKQGMMQTLLTGKIRLPLE